MLTTDPIYYKPLLPVIVIKNTAGGQTLYNYSGITDTLITGPSSTAPLYCSVTLSQNTHGEFVIQFEDPNKLMELNATVGSRVQISCGKPGGAPTNLLISGVVRRKGYTRGADNRILYTIGGSSTAIRLNERVIYNVSEAARTSTGQIDTTDTTRNADFLLETLLIPYFSNNPTPTNDLLTVYHLATNSDVETFIPSVQVEYGELQDLVNYLEDQSGGEVIVDTSDVVHFRHELKNTVQGRGFTLKNSDANKTNDDADDTMYLRGKNWSYEDSFYKSDVYGNRVYGIWQSETQSEFPSPAQTGTFGLQNMGPASTQPEWAIRFRPTHAHFLPGDIYICGSCMIGHAATGTQILVFRIAGPETASTGSITNNLPVVANIYFNLSDFPNDYHIDDGSFSWVNTQTFVDSSINVMQSFDLSTTNDYWLIMTGRNMVNNSMRTPAPDIDGENQTYETRFIWRNVFSGANVIRAEGPYNNTSGISSGSGWGNVTTTANTPGFLMPRRRSQSFIVWDPKATNAIASGMSAGQTIDSVLSDVPVQVTTKDAMCRHLSQQLYAMARPRTTYSFPKVTAPNIPPLPGDPIVISDDILGFSATTGNQVVLAVCGDMTYSWGQLGSGNYEAPTNLAIQAVAVHPRYR